MKENEVNTPYLIEGEDFNPDDTDGVWIANAFAKKRDLHVGDAFTIEYNGVTFTKTIRGLVESVEYEFRQGAMQIPIWRTSRWHICRTMHFRFGSM